MTRSSATRSPASSLIECVQRADGLDEGDQLISTQHAERLKAARINVKSASSMSEMNKSIEEKVITKTSESIASLMTLSKKKKKRHSCCGKVQTPRAPRTAAVTLEPRIRARLPSAPWSSLKGCVTGSEGSERVNSVGDVMTAVAQQLVSVVIRADSVLFQLYSGGDMQFWCGRNLDQGVLVAVARVSRVSRVAKGTTQLEERDHPDVRSLKTDKPSLCRSAA